MGYEEGNPQKKRNSTLQRMYQREELSLWMKDRRRRHCKTSGIEFMRDVHKEAEAGGERDNSGWCLWGWEQPWPLLGRNTPCGDERILGRTITPLDMSWGSSPIEEANIVGKELKNDGRPMVGTKAPTWQNPGAVMIGCCRVRGWMELSDPERDMLWCIGNLFSMHLCCTVCKTIPRVGYTAYLKLISIPSRIMFPTKRQSSWHWPSILPLLQVGYCGWGSTSKGDILQMQSPPFTSTHVRWP